jgi:hypothetical protein
LIDTLALLLLLLLLQSDRLMEWVRQASGLVSDRGLLLLLLLHLVKLWSNKLLAQRSTAGSIWLVGSSTWEQAQLSRTINTRMCMGCQSWHC